MREVISKDKLYDVIEEAITILGDTVSSTLGPAGNNVIIDNGEEVPFITNDGATIARNLEVENKKVNTILEILKEACLKTEELVGDGTTTTIVLLRSMLLEGLEEIKKGMDAMTLKREFEEVLPLVIKILNEEKRKPTKKDYKMIAMTSSNDKEISTILAEVFYKMKEKYAIRLETSIDAKTYYKIQNGYNLEIDNIASTYSLKRDIIEMEDVSILIVKGYLDSLEKLIDIIQDSHKYHKNIVILAEEYSTELEQELLAYYLTENLNILLLKLPDYASHREKIEFDLATLAKASIKNINYEEISTSDLGKVDRISLNDKEIVLYSENENVKKLIEKLKLELKEEKSLYEKEFIGNRLSKLERGVATIYIGGITKTEIKEKKMRYEDALWALEEAKKGIVIGEGITYLKVSELLKDDNSALKIIKKALKEPFCQILKNKGISNSEEIIKEIKKSNFKGLYNLSLDKVQDSEELLIIDPVSVIVVAFKNAVSIMMMLLTTNYLVIRDMIEIKNDVL